MNELLLLFIICNIANVIIQTVKSLVTVKGSPIAAAVVNAVAYGFYTYIIVITNCELPMWQKMLIVGLCNLIGVFVVKFIEKKKEKDKLWKIEVTIPQEDFPTVKEFIDLKVVPANYINIDRYVLVNFYCKSQAQSKIIKDFLKPYNAKYFASESKIL